MSCASHQKIDQTLNHPIWTWVEQLFLNMKLRFNLRNCLSDETDIPTSANASLLNIYLDLEFLKGKINIQQYLIISTGIMFNWILAWQRPPGIESHYLGFTTVYYRVKIGHVSIMYWKVSLLTWKSAKIVNIALENSGRCNLSFCLKPNVD